ncbi:MAG: thiamine pyrophosphate-binding protein [Solobacterium sp.]|nr:thiamine pyrophosphate-binding protein [Solobacterium sp.]
MNVSEYIVKYLEDQGIEHAYVIVGGAALWICKALSRSEKLKYTFCNHEQAVVMAAEGYARVSGKPGLAFVTNGPALTNTITGMAQAYVDSSPVILITGNSNSAHVHYELDHDIRQYGTQDVKTSRLMEPVTKKHYLLDDPARTAEVIADAWETAKGGRPGPVCIEIPINIQGADCPCAYPPVFPKEEDKLPAETVKHVLKQLKQAERPLVLAGQGIRLSDSVGLFHQFIEKLDLPVVNSRMGIDTIESDSPYFVGRCGTHGSRPSHFAIETCDVLLVLGSHLAPNTTGYNVEVFSRQSHKILIECDPAELDKYGVRIDEPIEGDIHDFLTQACAYLQEEEYQADHGKWVACCADWKKRYPVMLEEYRKDDVINSYDLVDTVSRLAGENDIVAADTGSSCSIVAQTWQVKKGQRVFISGGLSAMGFWATSIGHAEANRRRSNVICFTGDGSLQMNIQECATLAAYRIPLKLFVLANDGYEFIRMSQGGYNINPPFGANIEDGVPIPQLQRVAEAYGLKYVHCHDRKALEEDVRAVLAADEPVICEVDVETGIEVKPRIRSIANPDGTFRMPAYENLYPYLDEEVLAEELKKAYGK